MKRSDEAFTFIVSREWGCTQLQRSPQNRVLIICQQKRASIGNLFRSVLIEIFSTNCNCIKGYTA